MNEIPCTRGKRTRRKCPKSYPLVQQRCKGEHFFVQAVQRNEGHVVWRWNTGKGRPEGA